MRGGRNKRSVRIQIRAKDHNNIFQDLGVASAVKFSVEADLIEARLSTILIVLSFVHLLSSQDIVTKRRRSINKKQKKMLEVHLPSRVPYKVLKK